MATRVSIIGHSGAAGTKPKWRDDELQAFERYNLEEGVLERGGTELKVTEDSGGASMTIEVAAGVALIEIQNDNLTPVEDYLVYFKNLDMEEIVVPTADGTHPRIDRIIARVKVDVDPNSTSSNVGVLELVQGTAAASPVAPAEPDNSITLALVSVPAGDITISNAQITDMRPYSSYKTNVMRDIIRAGFLNSHATATGTDTIAGVSVVPVTSYTDKYTLFFVAENNNTGAVTFNLDGVGAKAIKKLGTEALVANDLKAGVTYGISWSAADDNWKLITAVSNTPDGQEIGSIKAWPVKRAPANWLLCYGQAISRVTYASLFNIIVPSLGTFTVTIASPAVFSKTAHGLTVGDAVFFTTTGALPTGLTANTLYYVISTGLTADAFQVSATRGGAAVNTSGSQSGTHTVRECPYGLGDGSTTFNLPDYRGRGIFGHDLMGGTASGRMTTPTTEALGEVAAGEQNHQLTTAEMPSHSHTQKQQVDGGGTPTVGTQNSNDGQNGSTGSTGGDTPHNNMPPYNTSAIIIKYA